MNPEFEHMMETESAWHEQEAKLKAIYEHGFEAYAEKLDNAKEAFENNEHKLCCIDEGVPEGDMRAAGSGILMEGEARAEFIKKLKAAGVKEVTSHAGCGAAGLFREKMGITDKTADEVAIEGAKKIAEELGVPYAGHITELQRPKEFHDARVVYVDATGSFNPANVKELPKGFVISQKYMAPEQAISEAALAAAIAFGHHGFEKKFTEKSPLMMVWIGEQSAEDQEALAKALEGKPVKFDRWQPNFEEQEEQEFKMAA